MGRGSSRVRQRASQRFLINRPDLTRHMTGPDIPAPAQDQGLRDWPAIQSTHPAWWQVHRVEQVTPGLLRYVLIAETQTEAQAFSVAVRQLHQVRITKWGTKVRPYLTMRDPLIVSDEPGDTG